MTSARDIYHPAGAIFSELPFFYFSYECFTEDCPPFLDQVTLFGYKKGFHSRDQISCLPNFDRSTIPVKFFIRILKMVVFHTFEVSRHVNALSAHNQVKCKLCATEFNNNNVQVIKCHMESVHGHQFGDSVATQPKKPKSGFQIKISREEYLNTCVMMQAENHLPDSFWNSDAMKYMTRVYDQHFGVTTTAETMREQSASVTVQIKDTIREELRGQMVSVVFVAGTNPVRPFLAVSVQFMVALDIKFIHLGMVFIDQSTTSKCIETRIMAILSQFGVANDQIHTITDEKGTNDIRTPQDVLAVVEKCAVQCLDMLSGSSDSGTMSFDQQLTATAKDQAVRMAAEQQGVVDEDEEVEVMEAKQQALLLGKDYAVVEEPQTHVTVLEPFRRFTAKLQNDQYCFGDHLRDMIICCIQSSKLPGSLAESLATTMGNRKTKLTDPSNMPWQAALFMDRRFTFGSIAKDRRPAIVQYLFNLYDRIQEVKKRSPKSNDMDDEDDMTVPAKKDWRWDLKNFGTTEPKPDVNTFNVQKIWKRKLSSHPELAELANVVLAVPASQVAAGRTLSAVENLEATSTSNEDLERLVFLRLNKMFIPS